MEAISTGMGDVAYSDYDRASDYEADSGALPADEPSQSSNQGDNSTLTEMATAQKGSEAAKANGGECRNGAMSGAGTLGSVIGTATGGAIGTLALPVVGTVLGTYAGAVVGAGMGALAGGAWGMVNTPACKNPAPTGPDPQTRTVEAAERAASAAERAAAAAEKAADAANKAAEKK